MKRTPLLPSVLTSVLLAALAIGGCAKKQVIAEPTPPEPPPVVKPTPPPEPPPVAKPTPPPEPRPVAKPAPPPEPRPAPVPPTPPSPRLARIHFDFDEYVIRPDAREVLKGNAAYLQRNPGARIQIQGHCDERGTVEYNLALGENRARTAFRYLVDLGIDPNRMSTISYGEEKPLDPRHNEEAWALNRRAEFGEM